MFRWEVFNFSHLVSDMSTSTPVRWVAVPQCQPTNADSRSMSALPAPQLPIQSSSRDLTFLTIKNQLHARDGPGAGTRRSERG